MNKHKILPLFVLMFFLIACGQQGGNKENDGSKGEGSAITDSAMVKIATDAYMYGLPLILMDITRRQSSVPGTAMYNPPNQFRHSDAFPDATFKNVVRPNADTYYSTAFLDLSEEPVILSVPDTKGRYYMMPMLDAYSNVFASPGTRTTGNHAGNFLISGPQWNGTVPTGMKEIESPTNSVWIIGRTQVNSKEDGAKMVVPLQRQYKLTPLSAWGKTHSPRVYPADTTAPEGDPNAVVKNMPVEEYFNYLNELLAKYPPPAADQSVIENFATIGVGAGKKFNLNAIPASARESVRNVSNDIFTAFANEITSSKSQLVNGWNIGHKVIGSYGTDYNSRGTIAFFGLGANLKEDAIYPSCFFDKDGNQLNGANKYVLRFEKGKTPPANAFWSLTLYDPQGYFVDNPINRYTLGDRSKLKMNPDGSVEIYIQKDNPGKDKAMNWLPAPEGDFNLLLRVYWPKEEMLNNNWEPSAVVKTN